MGDSKLNAISLFSGAGMLDVGVASGLEYLGITHRTICFCEREAYAVSQLVALQEAGCLDAAPIHTDVTTFPGKRFRGLVDLIVGGFPCQDISIAGRRAGLDGKRSGLFFTILDIADDCDAPVLFLENVSAITTADSTVVDEAEGELTERAASRILGELADRGWDAEWLHLSASDVGASHRRERWFCLAVRQGRGLGVLRESSGGGGFADGGDEELADAGHAGPGRESLARGQQFSAERSAWGEFASLGEQLADTRSTGPQGSEQRGTRISHRGGQEAYGPTEQLRSALGDSEVPFFAPGPSDSRWSEIIRRWPHLAPAIESDVCWNLNGVAVLVGASRRNQLRAIGNGVCPLQAAIALVTLANRFR